MTVLFNFAIVMLTVCFFPGFLVISQTIQGDDLGSDEVRFAQRKSHHDTKQPILVVYTNDGRQRTPHYISPQDQGQYKLIDIAINQ